MDDPTELLAIVAEGVQFEPIARLYFAYFPTRFNISVFLSEVEAHNWVTGRIAKNRRRPAN
ncbi:MAG: hypothetical protein ABIY71_06355 [Flavobacteriales bacterium]